jgi:hypothetical protein
MKDLVKENLDKFLIVFVFLVAVGMWCYRATPFTEGCARDVVIAIVAYLTGKRMSSSLTDSTQNVSTTTTITPKEEVKP